MFLNVIRLKKYVKAVATCPFVFISVPDQYKAQEICDKVVSEDPFTLKCCLDRYKSQLCDKAVDDFPPVLKFVPDWLDASKILIKFIMLYFQMMIYSFSFFDEAICSLKFVHNHFVISKLKCGIRSLFIICKTSSVPS